MNQGGFRLDPESGLLVPRERQIDRVCNLNMGPNFFGGAAGDPTALSIYSDLLAWYDFEETGAGTTWPDSHTGAHHMTLLASRTNSQDGTGVGRNGRAASVNASSNTGGRIPRSNTAFDFGDTAFTIGFWWYALVLPAVNGFAYFLAGRWGGTAATQLNYYIGYQSNTSPTNTSKFRAVVRNSDDTATLDIQHTTYVPPSTSTWYFLVMSHDPANDQVNFYVNGNKQTSAWSQGVYSGGPANYSFGNGFRSDTTYLDTSRDVNHYHDSHFVLTKTITDAEEAYLRNSGSGMNYTTLKTAAGF